MRCPARASRQAAAWTCPHGPPRLEAGISVRPGRDDLGGPGPPLLLQFACFSGLFHFSKSPPGDPDDFPQNERSGARRGRVRTGAFLVRVREEAEAQAYFTLCL